MKLWLLTGCSGLMSCIVRAATETDARFISQMAFFGAAGEWMDTCVEIPHDGGTAVILATDNRP